MPKPILRCLAVAAAALFATTAAAQSTRPLDHLEACRLDADRIALSFTFEGGACQAPGEASLLPANGGVADVVVPTFETSEICAMQIVQVPFSGVLDADSDIITLDIAVHDPEGRVQALGSTDIAPPDDCEEPEEQAE
jgi:hypothetical protein